MLRNEHIQEAIVRAAEALQSSISYIKDKAAIIQEIEEKTGIDLVKNSYAIGSYEHNIKKDDLPAIRKVVGRLRVTAKDVPYDYDTTNEIAVTVQPIAKKYSRIRFVYRTHYSGGKKCHVVTAVHTSKSIVCKAN